MKKKTFIDIEIMKKKTKNVVKTNREDKKKVSKMKQPK